MSSDQSRHHFLSGSSDCPAIKPMSVEAAKYSLSVMSSVVGTAGARGSLNPWCSFRPFQPGVGRSRRQLLTVPLPSRCWLSGGSACARGVRRSDTECVVRLIDFMTERAEFPCYVAEDDFEGVWVDAAQEL